MTRELVVGLANLGRADVVGKVSEALDLIHRRMDLYDQVALLFNEIDEGDHTSPSDHDLIDSRFRRWEDHVWGSREPILTKGLPVRRSRSHTAAHGVPRQSPSRDLHEVIIDGGNDPDIVVIGGHYPAGAHNGHRPPWVKALLVAQYAAMLRLHRKRIRHHLRAGRHVVWAMDVNWRMFPRLHRREGTLRAHGPNRIRAIPAKGWTAHRGLAGAVDLPIEQLHRLEYALVFFRPVKH